jgi:serine/threonine protein kinase
VIGTLFAKRYFIRGFLGKGSNGEVWLADDQNTAQLVALTIFPAGSLTIHTYDEARILTLIANDNVLRVFNADTFVDVPYIATAVAGAGTTEDRAAAAPGLGLPAPVVVRWMRHCLVGLDACHALNLVHRDIKTSNLFLDSDDWALLGDFGIAHRVDAAGHVPPGGTPVTMPPEIFTLGYLTKVSDVYAVGVTGYRLLTGTWPFNKPTPAEMRQAIVNREYTSLRDAAPHASRRLAERIERAMAADPADRHQTAMALHHDLGAANLVRRTWQRQAPHTGHEKCWAELDPSGAPHEVCVIDRGPTFEIDSHFASGRRITAHSSTSVRPAELPRRLRQVFDHL